MANDIFISQAKKKSRETCIVRSHETSESSVADICYLGFLLMLLVFKRVCLAIFIMDLVIYMIFGGIVTFHHCEKHPLVMPQKKFLCIITHFQKLFSVFQFYLFEVSRVAEELRHSWVPSPLFVLLFLPFLFSVVLPFYFTVPLGMSYFASQLFQSLSDLFTDSIHWPSFRLGWLMSCMEVSVPDLLAPEASCCWTFLWSQTHLHHHLYEVLPNAQCQCSRVTCRRVCMKPCSTYDRVMPESFAADYGSEGPFCSDDMIIL